LQAYRRVLAVAGARPAGLIFDIDGTLAPMASTPTAARVDPRALAALERLTRLVDLVAVVTGRAARDGAAMIGLPHVLAVGNHGLETVIDGVREAHPEARPFIPAVAATMATIRLQVDADPVLHGCVLEDKELSGSVHYRLTADPDEAKRRLDGIVGEAAHAHGLKITYGRLVIEVRPPVDIDKGAAVRWIAETRGLRGVAFFGDDVTDMDGFRAVRELREAEGLDGVAVAVADAEARPEVIAAADVALPGVPACATLLEALADVLEGAAKK
jgi:trehalose 6-phosphate phosphatase